MRKLTTEEQNTLTDILLGTDESVEGGVRAIGIDPADVDIDDAEWMLPIQTCNRCDWWFESYNLDYDGYCNDCADSNPYMSSA